MLTASGGPCCPLSEPHPRLGRCRGSSPGGLPLTSRLTAGDTPAKTSHRAPPGKGHPQNKTCKQDTKSNP